MSKAARRFTNNVSAIPIATIVESVGELVAPDSSPWQCPWWV